MTRVTVAGFLSRKLRAVLTGIAIALGVALMSGTYILTDTINQTFAGIFSTANQGHSVVITAHPAIGRRAKALTATINETTLARVRAVPGVAVASGAIFAPVSLLKGNGERLGKGFSFVTAVQPPPFENFSPASGHLPAAAAQAALDQATADSYGVHLGDTLVVAGAAPARRYTVVGILRFAGSSSVGGAGAALLTLPEAQRAAGEPGSFDQINVAAAGGVSDTTLRDRLRAVLPATYDVRTGAQEAAQQTSDLQSALSPLRTFLLVFAYVALFVGAFIIFNTFAITVAQRTREFGLLRTLGATRRQLLRSVLGEGVLLGLLGSALGLLAGLAVAPGLEQLFKSVLGATLPTTGDVVEFRTVWVSLLAGTAVTVLSALVPAIRATRVTPVAAMREGAPTELGQRKRLSTEGLTVRLAVVAVLSLLGVGELIRGSVVIGLVLIVVSVGCGLRLRASGSINFITPAVAWLGRGLGSVVARRGVVGRLARDNAIRQPGRTAVTAAALMIGLALCTFAAILAAGLKASIDNEVNRAFAGNLIIENASRSSAAGIPATIPAALMRIPGVQAATPIAFTQGKIAGISSNTNFTAVDPVVFGRLYRIDWAHGSNAVLATLDSTGALVTKPYADTHHLHVGQTVSVLTPTGERISLQIRGIATNDTAGLLTNLTIDIGLARSAFAQRTDAFDFVRFTPAATNAQVQPAVDRLLAASYPQAQSRTAAQFKADEASQVNQLLAFVYVLLALSIIVSLFGIVNTLVLSIYERRRELGMLRAIGTSRRQVRALIRDESIITALIGGVLGIVLGIIIALISFSQLSSSGFVLAFPVGTLVLLLVFAALAGVLAASWPARRAAKVDVLEALATE